MPHYKNTKNDLYFLDDNVFAHTLPNDCVQITDEEACAIREQNKIAAFAALSYQEKRAAEYPSFADQFDLLYHGGIDAWKAAIDAVKNKYPKGAA